VEALADQKLSQAEGGRYGIGIGEVVGLYEDPSLFLPDQADQFFRKDKVLPIVINLLLVYHHTLPE